MLNTEKIIEKLKAIMEQNGPDYLTDEPYEVYRELLRGADTDKKTAALILYGLVNGVTDEAGPDGDPVLLSKAIQRRCGLNKKTADRLAAIFLALYSKENEQDWKAKNRAGLAQFLREEMFCTWKGSAVWDEGNGTVDCYYRADLILSPSEAVAGDQKLTQMLKKNPFMTKEAIRQYFEKDLFRYLDSQFEEYCICDDYYQPVAEDFEIDYYASEWCGKHGFELVSCEGGGGDGGYEPKLRRGGWY